MSRLRAVFRPVVSLFVEDGALAASVAAVVLVAALLAAMLPNVPSAAAAMLLFGCLGVLAANVLGVARG